MSPSAPLAAAGGWLGGDGLTAAIGVGLLVLVAALFAVLLLSRRRLGRDTREVVQALEDLRLGQGRPRSETDVDSPLALVFDAIARLGEDVAAKVRGAESRDEQVRAVMAAMSDNAVITTDIDGEIRGFSPGARRLLGWDEAQVTGRPVSMLFEEASYKDFLPRLARRSLREKGVVARATLVRREGDGFEAEVSVRMLHGPAGDPTGFLLVAREISVQVELEGRLRESEQRYRSLVEGLADGVLIVSGGQVLYANRAFGELCGVEPERLIGSPLRERLATRDLLLVEERLAELESGAAAAAELVCRLVTDDGGAEREVAAVATALRYGGSPAVRLVVRDETLERRVVGELRRNESQLDAVIEATSDGILVLVEGAQGRFVKMTNRAFVERFELSVPELLGRSESGLLDLLRSRGRPAAAVASYLESAVRGGGREVLTVGGRGMGDLELTIRPLVDTDGTDVGRVLACRDLTEQRESERRLQLHAEQQQLSRVMLERAYRRIDRTNKDLQQRTEQLDRLNRELRKLNEMKSNLLGNVSHELQTPLVSIRGYTEMILKERLGPVTDEQRRGLTLGLKNIDRLISMIDNLLVFSRSEAELGQLHPEAFPLRALIEESIALLEDTARDRGITTEYHATDEIVVIADRDKIQQVFINLLSNAIKFNKPGGNVKITAREARPGFAGVVVEDSGVGIPAAAIDHVFERHYQVSEDPANSPRGSGIGLAIVQDILRSHGCTIDVTSESGRGARFYFSLPLSGAESVAEGGAVAAEPEAEAPRIERGDSEPTPTEPTPTEPSTPDPPARDRPTAVDDPPAQADPPSDSAPSTPGDETDDSRPGRPRFRIIRRPS